MSIRDPKPPKDGEWVDFTDDRRRLLLYGGPLTDPLGTLAQEGWDEFELLSTPRALADGGGLGEAAGRTHLIAPGGVPEASAAIVDDVGSDRLVAFGGGRVIDSAKADRRGPRRRGGGDPDHPLGRPDDGDSPAARRAATRRPGCGRSS